ncbi:hypothetical protein BC940DRAFT_312931 [Gongronella butleri]|nr:hypothetical protein BC940DRAFT_312931 [Gongronella butleri]
MKKLLAHPIQLLHLWNCLVGIVSFIMLVVVVCSIKAYVSSGAEVAGFGNYNVFVYPATLVYMFIPIVSAIVFAAILALDPSPKYTRWAPSRTLATSVALVCLTLLIAAVLPLIPGADVMTAPDASMDCTWKNYMSWYVIYANPDAFPWVTKMDTACTSFTGAIALNWILAVGWLAATVLYVRKSVSRRASQHRKSVAVSERSLRALDAMSRRCVTIEK